MRIPDHILAVMVHGVILLAALLLVLTTSCEKEEPPPDPDPVADYFDALQDGLDAAAAVSVTVIAVDDTIGAGDDLKRQVYQETLSRLYDLDTVSILEYPIPRLQAAFQELGITPSDGIAPEDIIELAREFDADAFLYASIESDTPDVHFKLYSGETGAVVFAATLSDWQLPVSREEEFDFFGGPAAIGEAESTGTPSGETLDGI